MKSLIKTHKKTQKILTYSCHLLRFGSCGIKILSDLRFTTEQITSLNRFLLKKLKDLSGSSKKLKFWSFLQTNRTLTKLSLESRMGKGKRPIYTEVLFLRKGSIILEFNNLKGQQLKEIYYLVEKQLSVKLKLVLKK